MALDGVLKLSLYLSLFVRNCPLKCPRRNLQNETYCYGQAQTKTPETLVVSGVLQVSGINSALAELQGLGSDPAKHLVISSLST